MMNPLYSSWNNALDYSRYPRGNPRGNTAPTVLPQMHYRYRGSTVHSVPSPRYYREILPIPTVITAVTAVLPHSPLPCHSLWRTQSYAGVTTQSRIAMVNGCAVLRCGWLDSPSSMLQLFTQRTEPYPFDGELRRATMAALAGHFSVHSLSLSALRFFLSFSFFQFLVILISFHFSFSVSGLLSLQ